jgi:hypothetical protein
MTARLAAMPRYVDGSSLARRLQPAEGWITLLAIAALPWTLGWSLDDAGWVPGIEGPTGYLTWLGVAAAAVGILFAKLPLGRFRADLAGAIVGGLVVPFVAGGIILANQASLGLDPASILARYQAAATVAANVWRDLVVEGRPFTSEYGHYHMIFAGFIWASGILAATATIRRRRPLDAVIVCGVLLLTDMALTAHEQLQILVVFSIASLTLLLRTHVFEEQLTWVRRRIGDPVAVGGLYLQGGAAFVGAAVLGALVLTGSASSAPLQGMWADVPQRLAELSRILQRFAPTGGDTRGIGAVSFGPNATTRGLWNPDQNAVAFVATLPANATQHFKWRAGAYSTYTLFGWSWGITHDTARDARAPLLTGTGDDPNQDIGRTAIRIQIQPQAFIDSAAVSPQSIDWVDRPSTLLGVGEQNRFTTVQLGGGGGPYTEQALIPIIGDAGGGITENRLRAAGRNYPTDITAVYLPLPDGAVGPAAQAILDQVEATFGSKAAAEAKPYDLARAIESYLHDPANFQYQTDVQAAVRAQCDGISTVECFARIRRGYCEYYASTMTVLLRAAGIPARVAYGFLPGTRTPDGIESVPASAAHWWVEVYFPRSGWVEFDPTGSVGQPEQLPSGAPVTPPPSGLFTLRPDRETDVIPRSSGGGGGVVTNRPTGSGPFVAVGVILAIAVVVIGWAARRRSPRAPMHPDQAWGGLGRLAARFGFGPRPEQTVYEYAGALSDLVPAARVEVGTVARAKVEVAYGRRELGVDRLRVVGDAYRRLRFAVLRAGLGRRFRRRKR